AQQLGAAEIGAAQIALVEVGVLEIGSAEIGPRKPRAMQDRSDQDRALEVRSGEIAPLEHRIGEVAARAIPGPTCEKIVDVSSARGHARAAQSSEASRAQNDTPLRSRFARHEPCPPACDQTTRLG